MQEIKAITKSFLIYWKFVILAHFEHAWECLAMSSAMSEVAKLYNSMINLQQQRMSICTQKNPADIYSLKDIQVINPAIWLADCILDNNTKTRILPNMGFSQEYQELYAVSFFAVS